MGERLLGELIDAEAAAHIGAQWGEHDLDTQLAAFRERPLDQIPFPYIYFEATYCKVRVNHQTVSQAVVIATGITEDGNREVLGVMVGDNETEAFWSEFLRSLRARGLTGVRLVIAHHHSGLVAAIRKVMLGAAYRRCRVHWGRTETRCRFQRCASLAWYGVSGGNQGSTRCSARGLTARQPPTPSSSLCHQKGAPGFCSDATSTSTSSQARRHPSLSGHQIGLPG